METTPEPIPPPQYLNFEPIYLEVIKPLTNSSAHEASPSDTSIHQGNSATPNTVTIVFDQSDQLEIIVPRQQDRVEQEYPTDERLQTDGGDDPNQIAQPSRANTADSNNHRPEQVYNQSHRSDLSKPPSFKALPSGWQPPPLSQFDLEEINDAKIALTPDPVWRDQISRAMNGSSDPADKDAFMDAYSLVPVYGDVVDIVRLVTTAVKDPSKISGGMVAAAVLPYTLGQIRVINALGRIGSELGPFPTWLEKTDKGRRTWRRKKRKNSKPRKRKTKLSEELKQYLREQRKEDIKRIKEKQKIWIRARVEEELSKEGRSVDLIRERIKGQINEAGHKTTYMNKLLEKYLKELGR